MTPAEFRAARKKLGFTARELAEVLGIKNERTVRRWEKGEREIPGPVLRLMDIYLDGKAPTPE